MSEKKYTTRTYPMAKYVDKNGKELTGAKLAEMQARADKVLKQSMKEVKNDYRKDQEK